VRKLLVAAAATALVAGAVVPGVDAASRTKLKATLTGAAEGAGGDADGTGTARIRLFRKKVCFTIRMQNIGNSAAAHIHTGARGVTGPVLVTLIDTVSDATTRTGCSGKAKGATQRVIRSIRRHPRRFYVNVHNAEHPGGAIRGQLHR